jgi:hypothetical protein
MSEKYINVEVPFTVVGNHRCLTGLQLMQEPWLREFVERFKDSFVSSPNQDVLFFIERK